MKKATSDSGTVHLFSNVAVLRHTGQSTQEGGAQSLCGSFRYSGPFTAVNDEPEEIDGLCENCSKAVEDRA